MIFEATNYYQVLEVDPNVDQVDIDAAFRRLARLYHPDRNDSASATTFMQELNVAYSVLRDPVQRLSYDKQLQLRNSKKRSGINLSPLSLQKWLFVSAIVAMCSLMIVLFINPSTRIGSSSKRIEPNATGFAIWMEKTVQLTVTTLPPADAEIGVDALGEGSNDSDRTEGTPTPRSVSMQVVKEPDTSQPTASPALRELAPLQDPLPTVEIAIIPSASLTNTATSILVDERARPLIGILGRSLLLTDTAKATATLFVVNRPAATKTPVPTPVLREPKPTDPPTSRAIFTAVSNLTPAETSIPSRTPQNRSIPTSTGVPTTNSGPDAHSPSSDQQPIPTATLTESPTASATNTSIYTVTPTPIPATATATDTRAPTDTATATSTPLPTNTVTSTYIPVHTQMPAANFTTTATQPSEPAVNHTATTTTTPTAADTQLEDAFRGMILQNVGLYREPSVGTTVATLFAGDVVRTAYSSDDGLWYRLDNGYWIEAKFVEKEVGDTTPVHLSNAEVAQETALTSVALDTALIGTANRNVNLHSVPGNDSTVVASVFEGTVVTIVVVTTDQKWYQLDDAYWLPSEAVTLR